VPFNPLEVCEMSRLPFPVWPSAAILLASMLLTHSAVVTHARDNRVEFALTDEPGRWYENEAGPVAGNGSLAVATPGVEVKFRGRSHTVHTMSSLLWPSGATSMPFDTEAMKGSASVVLRTPGLYVFVCKVHPYMLGAVIVDDAFTKGLDLGEQIALIDGPTVPTTSDLATRLLRTFFIATSPANWQDFTAASGRWHVTYPSVDVRLTGGVVANLAAVLSQRYGNDLPLPRLFKPAIPGVGEVWVDTQFERTAGKGKPGTVTKVDASTWQVARKVALPQINMNNPHNMWTDRQQRLIYQTEWFDSKLTVFERETGRFVRQISVGEAPAHVMTRTDTDQVHVSINGEEDHRAVVELSPGATNVERRIDIGRPHPHAHWMSHDGKTMVTPNVFTSDSSIYDFDSDRAAVIFTGSHPIATGMMPDSSKYYVANFLSHTLTALETRTGRLLATIDLLANYDPISGAITGPVGGLPIQTPVSPDGKYMVTANTLTATITITDTATDRLVAMLPGDAGTHGVQFGAKRGGGYYAYVANKFSNTLLIVDADPDGDGRFDDATLAGRVLLTAASTTARDDRIVGLAGMGGQGVLAIPVPYNGWVQRLPAVWREQLTAAQRNPAQ
jgi:DNA-binding beta-propeller fold protein YncE